MKGFQDWSGQGKIGSRQFDSSFEMNMTSPESVRLQDKFFREHIIPTYSKFAIGKVAESMPGGLSANEEKIRERLENDRGLLDYIIDLSNQHSPGSIESMLKNAFSNTDISAMNDQDAIALLRDARVDFLKNKSKVRHDPKLLETLIARANNIQPFIDLDAASASEYGAQALRQSLTDNIGSDVFMPNNRPKANPRYLVEPEPTKPPVQSAPVILPAPQKTSAVQQTPPQMPAIVSTGTSGEESFWALSRSNFIHHTVA